MNSPGNALQKDIFHSTRMLRNEASAAQKAYNRAYQEENPFQRNYIDLFDRLETADMLYQNAEHLYQEAQNKGTLEFETLEEAEPRLESAYEAMDYIESELDILEQFDNVYAEPLEIAMEDYSKLLFRIVPTPVYREGKEMIDDLETSKRRTELQKESYLTAEKIEFSSSKLKTLIERADEHNIDAAIPLLEDQTDRTRKYHMTGIGTLKDVLEYRKDNNLLEHSSYEGYRDPCTKEVTDFDVEDVDLTPLHEAMEQSHRTLTYINRLTDEDLLEEIDDSEILDPDILE